jgi:hypothetical protein
MKHEEEKSTSKIATPIAQIQTGQKSVELFSHQLAC